MGGITPPYTDPDTGYTYYRGRVYSPPSGGSGIIETDTPEQKEAGRKAGLPESPGYYVAKKFQKPSSFSSGSRKVQDQGPTQEQIRLMGNWNAIAMATGARQVQNWAEYQRITAQEKVQFQSSPASGDWTSAIRMERELEEHPEYQTGVSEYRRKAEEAGYDAQFPSEFEELKERGVLVPERRVVGPGSASPYRQPENLDLNSGDWNQMFADREVQRWAAGTAKPPKDVPEGYKVMEGGWGIPTLGELTAYGFSPEKAVQLHTQWMNEGWFSPKAAARGGLWYTLTRGGGYRIVKDGQLVASSSQAFKIPALKESDLPVSKVVTTWEPNEALVQINKLAGAGTKDVYLKKVLGQTTTTPSRLLTGRYRTPITPIISGVGTEMAWIEGGEAFAVNQIRRNLGWMGSRKIAGGLTPEFIKTAASVPVWMAGGFLKALASSALLLPASEYWTRHPSEATRNVIPGLTMQTSLLAEEWGRSPVKTSSELAGPFVVPWAVKKFSPITAEIARMPTGAEKTTLWGKVGINERTLRIPTGLSREMIDGKVKVTGLRYDSTTVFKQKVPDVSRYAMIMGKRPLSAPGEGGYPLLGIGRIKTGTTSITRPFKGYPKALMEKSLWKMPFGDIEKTGGFTRGQTALMNRAMAASAPKDLPLFKSLQYAAKAESLKIPYEYSRETIPHAAVTDTELTGIYGQLAKAGKKSVWIGSRSQAQLWGQKYFRDVKASDIDLDQAFGTMEKSYKGFSEVFSKRYATPQKAAREFPALPGRQAEAVIAGGGSREGFPEYHFMEVPKATDTARIIGAGALKARPEVAKSTMFIETAGGKVQIATPSYALRSYMGRTFGESTWVHKPGKVPELNLVISETKNLPDIWAVTRGMAKSAYTAPKALRWDISGVRAGRRRTLGVGLEELSNVVYTRFEKENVPGFKEVKGDILKGVNRQTPGPKHINIPGAGTGSFYSGLPASSGGKGYATYPTRFKSSGYYGIPPAIKYPMRTASYPARGKYPVKTPGYPAKALGYPVKTPGYPVKTTYPVKTPGYPAKALGYPVKTTYPRGFATPPIAGPKYAPPRTSPPPVLIKIPELSSKEWAPKPPKVAAEAWKITNPVPNLRGFGIGTKTRRRTKK